MNASEAYIRQVAGHFDPPPLAYEILARYGRAFDSIGVCPKFLRGQMGECFRTALNLAAFSSRRLAYCEGYAVSVGRVALEHAWCVDTHGNVIDPTWPNGRDYFGTVFDLDGLHAILRVTGRHGVYGNLHLLRDLGVAGARDLVTAAVAPYHGNHPPCQPSTLPLFG